ncbi:MAG: CoA-binding protein [Candidatus Kapaibacteriota bacterium]
MNMKEIFDNYKNITVVGMSRHLDKAAFTVPGYMKKQGYNIIPVNPNAETIMKLKVYPNLMDIEETIDMVNVFRPGYECLEVVEEAIARHRQKGDVKLIWLQLGIINNDAQMLAEENGIQFIQDKCIYVEHREYLKGL